MRAFNLIVFILFSQQLFALNVTLATKFLNFGYVANTTTSLSKNFIVTIPSGTGTVTTYVDAPYEVSLDNINFNDSVYTPMTSSAQNITVYVHYKPTINAQVNKANVWFLQNTSPAPQKVYLLGNTFNPTDYYSIASWNMKWFGNPGNCSCDTTVQTANAKKIMKYLNADLYALQEIVDHNKMAQMASNMGPSFDYLLPDFCSFALDTFDASYDNGQKTTYIYNKNAITPFTYYGMGKSLGATGTPYNSFASGRYPFAMHAKINGTSDSVLFLNIHAKSGSGSTDYQRRASGSKLIDDSIKAQYNNSKALLIGDFNDLLEGTTVTGFTNSPYDTLLLSTMNGISKPSVLTGQTTYVTVANALWDNLCVTDELLTDYAPNSFFIFNAVDFDITNYVSTTSDHFPVMAYFKKNKTAVNISSYNLDKINIQNPVLNNELIINNENGLYNFSISVFDLTGKEIIKIDNTLSLGINKLPININSGLYFLKIQNSNKIFIQKILVQ